MEITETSVWVFGATGDGVTVSTFTSPKMN